MKILAISGSASPKGSNYLLLEAIQQSFSKNFQMEIFNKLHDFPLFTPELLQQGIPTIIQSFKNKLEEAEAVLIATPEYTHNIPAVLKNMIEWCTAYGEFYQKKVIPITFTPVAPRGEFAMKSLFFSLQALGANVLTTIPIYKTDVELHDDKIQLTDNVSSLLKAAFDLL